MPGRDTGTESRRRFVVLDRDGTIIEERHYLSDPNGVALIPEAATGLHRLTSLGLGLVVITNQSGINRGYFDEASVASVHQRMCQLLEKEGVHLDGIYFCPHTPDEDCGCRKPRPVLLNQAADEHGFDPRDSFFVGDKVCDIELGQAVGGATILVATGYGSQVYPAGPATPDYAVEGLLEASGVIEDLLKSATPLKAETGNQATGR